MGRGCAFCCALLSVAITVIVAPSCRASVSIRGVDPALYQRYAAIDGKFGCLDGSKSIPYAQLNDGYCDCIDGSDEPGTAACANGSFYCPNIGSEPKILNASFVDDGVCDCCDGSDEPRGLCRNSCREKAELEVKRLSQEASDAESGMRIRAKYIKTAAQAKKSWSVRLQEISRLEPEAQKRTSSLKNEYTSLKGRLSRLQAKKARLEALLKPSSDSQGLEDSIEHPDDADISTSSELKGDEGIDDLEDDLQDAMLQQEKDMMEFENTEPEEKEESSEELAKRIASQWIPGAKQDSKDEQEASDDPTVKESDKEPALSWDGTQEVDDEMDDLSTGIDDSEAEAEAEAVFGFFDSVKLWLLEAIALIRQTAMGVGNSSTADPQYKKLCMAVESLQIKVNAAQTDLNAADAAYSKLVDEKNDLEAKMGQSYGPDDVFAVLGDHCVEAPVEKYTYRICPFQNAEQLDGGKSTLLGKWAGMSFREPQKEEGVLNNPATVEFRFENGESCWQGPSRSIHVSVKCGSVESLYKVAEPSRCEYTAEMTTPAACSSELVASLRQALDSKRALLNSMPKDEL